MNRRQNHGRCRESKRIYSLVHLFLFAVYREVAADKGSLPKEGNASLKIDSCVIGMESARTYQSNITRKLSYRMGMGSTGLESETEGELDTREDLENTKEGGEGSLEELQAQFTANVGFRRIRNVDAQDEFSKALEEIRQQSILYLWHLFFGDEEGKNLAERLGIESTQSYSSGLEKISQDQLVTAQPRQLTILQLSAREEDFYSETESTSFSSTGMVRTADGREISFNLDVSMSRSFSQYTSRRLEAAVMCDPLVINLNGNIANVSDQKFFFDLDADGEEEAISRLGEGSGYLALDLNGDGIINDGSELFGTKSGNGFADLAKYDEDGNGWIDENDSIWQKLKIWIQKEDGTSSLYGLKEKDVGAICLQNAATEFTHKNDKGEVNAAIRSTGIFLYENGMAGTLQHLDLAVGQLA